MKIRYAILFTVLISLTTVTTVTFADRQYGSGRITEENDTEIITFELGEVQEGDILKADIFRTSGNLDLVVSIVDENSRPIIRPYIGEGSRLPIDYSFENTGNYLLVITRSPDNETVGEFTVVYEVISGDAASDYNQLGHPGERPYVNLFQSQSLSDSITVDEVDDRYYIFLQQGDKISLDVRLPPDSNLKPWFLLLDKSDRPLARGEFTEENIYHLQYESVESAWYTILITRRETEDTENVGNYILDVHLQH